MISVIRRLFSPHLARSSYLSLYLSRCFEQCSVSLHLYVRNGPRPGNDMGICNIVKLMEALINPVVYTVVSSPSSFEDERRLNS